MIKLLDRYIIINIAKYVALVTLLALGILLLFTFMREYRHLDSDTARISDLLLYLLLTIPKSLYRIFPMVSLLGALMGLTAMALRSELIIMRQAGRSILQIAKPLLLISFVLTLLITAVGEWVLPAAEVKAANIKNILRGHDVYSASGGSGFWLRDGDNFIYVNRVLTDKSMRGIIRYALEEDLSMRSISQAAQAKFMNGHWDLQDIQEQTFSETGAVKSQHYDALQWPSRIKPSFFDTLKSDPDELSIRGLWQTMRYMRVNELDDKPYALAAWAKIFQPFATMVMVLLAISFVFGPLRSSAMGLRMLAGITSGFVFYVMNKMVVQLGILYNIPAALATLLPSLVVLAVTLALMRKMA